MINKIYDITSPSAPAMPSLNSKVRRKGREAWADYQGGLGGLTKTLAHTGYALPTWRQLSLKGYG